MGSGRPRSLTTNADSQRAIFFDLRRTPSHPCRSGNPLLENLVVFFEAPDFSGLRISARSSSTSLAARPPSVNLSPLAHPAHRRCVGEAYLGRHTNTSSGQQLPNARISILTDVTSRAWRAGPQRPQGR